MGFHQLVARGQHGDTRPAVHRHLGTADGCQQTDLSRPDATASRQDVLTSSEIHAWRMHVFAAPRTVVQHGATVRLLHLLDHDHRVGPVAGCRRS